MSGRKKGEDDSQQEEMEKIDEYWRRECGVKGWRANREENVEERWRICELEIHLNDKLSE